VGELGGGAIRACVADSKSAVPRRRHDIEIVQRKMFGPVAAELRPRSDAVPRRKAAGYDRHVRARRGALGELVATGSRHRDRKPGGQSRRLKALYIDCGEKDQFNLLYGARRLVRRLNELGIWHRYEEFPDNPFGVDYRMDESLPFLAQALSGRC
jgi:hypothetical protein